MFVNLVRTFKVNQEQQKRLGCDKGSKLGASQMARMHQEMQPQMKKRNQG